MRRTMLLAAGLLLAGCATAEPPQVPAQRLTAQERADLECARVRIVAGDTELQASVTEAILAHAGKPGPVDLGEPCGE